jgi:hypothetical protein
LLVVVGPVFEPGEQLATGKGLKVAGGELHGQRGFADTGGAGNEGHLRLPIFRTGQKMA